MSQVSCTSQAAPPYCIVEVELNLNSFMVPQLACDVAPGCGDNGTEDTRDNGSKLDQLTSRPVHGARIA